MSLISVTYEGIRYDNARFLVGGGTEVIPTGHRSALSPNAMPSAREFRVAAKRAEQMAESEMQSARGWKRQLRLGIECAAQVTRRVRRARWWNQQARWLRTMATKTPNA